MNKKGFTLVELLAVIAILAILVIIALPNVMGMFNSAKINTFVTEVQSIYKQVATDFVNDSIEKTGAINYCQDLTVENVDATGLDTCEALDLTTSKGYYVKVGRDGAINRLVVWDGSFYYASPDAVAKVTDIDKKDVVGTDKLTSTTKLVVKDGTPSSIGQGD